MHSWHDTRFLIQMTGHMFRKNTCGDGIMLTVYVYVSTVTYTRALARWYTYKHANLNLWHPNTNKTVDSWANLPIFEDANPKCFSFLYYTFVGVGHVGSKPYRAFYRIHEIPKAEEWKGDTYERFLF